MKTSMQFLLVTWPVVVLLGCGGGSTSVTAPVPAAATAVATTPAVSPVVATGPVVPIEAAITALYSTTQHYGRTETATGTTDTYVFSRDFTAGAVQAIDNMPVNSVAIAGSVSKNGTLQTTSLQTDYFLTMPYRLIARKFAGSPLYLAAASQQPLPLTGKAGDSGNFYTAVTYDSVGKANVVSSATQTWAITPDTATSVTFCIQSVTTIAQLASTTTRSDCYRIDTSGTVTSVAFVLPN